MVTGLAILGSTGSIGRQALEVAASLAGRFEVLGLAAGHTDAGLREQLETHRGARAWSPQGRPDWLSTDRWAGDGLEELATADGVDLVLVATTGIAALPAVLAALRAGRTVALANKETLVTGGHLVDAALDELAPTPEARLERLRPIDSEHSAIWQCLVGERAADVARLVLTASGGPFRGRPPEDLAGVGPNDALAHPTWRMGPKVTIDSATLVNKAFEVIEARWLYRVPYRSIAAVIHPQSVVHSLVEFADGSYKAQLGAPDMRLPIQYALTFPERLPSTARGAPPDTWGTLSFESLTPGAYPAYEVVRAAAEAGGNRGVVVNAADEVAVAAFLAGSLAFTGIGPTIEAAVSRWGSDAEPSLDDVLALDAEVRAALQRELGVGEA